jgi:hypothetical protein
MDEQEMNLRMEMYKTTAEKRKKLNKYISCPNCGGAGKFLELVEEIPTYVDCTRCEGTGLV